MKYEINADNYQESPLMADRAIRFAAIFDFDLEYIHEIKVWSNAIRFDMTATRGGYTKAYLFAVIKS